MRRCILNLKILFTNVLRVITSILFIDLNFSYINKVLGASTIDFNETTITCYATGPMLVEETTKFTLRNILIILVPIAIIIGVAIILIRKKRNKSKGEKKYNDKQN